MTVHYARTFETPDGVAVLLPDALGVAAGETVRVSREQDRIVVEPEEAAATVEERKLAEFIAELQAIGPVGEIGPREPFEFPDRPRLY